MKRIVVLTTLFIATLASVSLGQITLRGKVIDAKSGKALIGANVRLVGTSIGIATNNKGEFVLEKVPTVPTRSGPVTPVTKSVP